ncbi:fumarylacetoacetate hydrolase family protein [Lichenicoccus sp.]|uniref:fumarylacetoacetate hydrolase family protein n=1 Tax=Lichenicoccus sp. TaxID=2781899 RepID=UPI003D12CBB6
MSQTTVIPVPPAILLPTALGAAFPVRRVYCVGRNYAEHAREMGADPDREPPFFFSKPADALLAAGADMPYPPGTDELHHEIELVAALRSGGSDIAVEDAPRHVWGYGVGLDMTRRDIQAAAKKQGRPWDMAKGFDHSAPIGLLVPAADIEEAGRGAITLRVNGGIRQQGELGDMIWPLAETIMFLSRLVRLEAGDLIFTGTPSGVGPVKRGDLLEGHIHGVGEVKVRIVDIQSSIRSDGTG